MLDRGPAFYGPVALILRCAKEVWALRLRSYLFILSWAEIREAWDCAFRGPGPNSWKKVAGLIGARKLSLARIGWGMPSFTAVVDRSGAEYLLTRIYPACLKRHLRRAIQCYHERRSGAQLLGHLPLPARVCHGQVYAMLQNKRFTPYRRGCIKAVCCNAVWTTSRATAAGYQLPCSLCPLCENVDDAYFHRLWHCPASEDTRGDTVGKGNHIRPSSELTEVFDPAEYILCTRGIYEHPGDLLPRLTADGENNGIQIIWRQDPAGTSTRFQGYMFVDGSCSREVSPELSRAGWAVILSDGQGRHLASISGPLLRQFFRAPQRPSLPHSLRLPNVGLRAPFLIFSDCLNVVRQALEPLAAKISYRRPCAGFLLQTLGQASGATIKVKGRQLDRPDLTDEQKFHKLGNDSADAAARQAAARRPRPSQAERDKLSRQQLIARLVCLLAADVMPMFPGLALCEVVRLKPPPAPEAPPGPRHVWHWEGRFWLCWALAFFAPRGQAHWRRVPRGAQYQRLNR